MNVKQMTMHVSRTVSNYFTANRVGYEPMVN